MLDILFEKLKKFFSSRLLPITIVYIGLFVFLVYRLFVLQIIQYDTNVQEETQKITKTREIKSTRGIIYDRNGKKLAYNELAYSIVIEDSTALDTNQKKNDTIYRLIKLIEKNGDKIDVDFPLRLTEDGELEFSVSGSALKRFRETAFAYLMEKGELTDEQLNATPQEIFDYLRSSSMFDLPENYTKEELYNVMAIRYAIFSNFPKYLQITVATRVSDATVASIKENKDSLIGVDIKQDSYRVYEDSEYFSHILGYTGRISSTELEEMKDKKKYNSTDMIGKSGIEKEFEAELNGEKGSETVTVNEYNKVVSIDDVKEPVAGNDVYLTIDSELQKAAYHILENKIAGILLGAINNGTSYGSKGTSASKIEIPIYEVYNALISNNVIDITKLNEEDATELEKSIYDKFVQKQNSVLKDINKMFATDYITPNDKTPDDMGDYLDYIYSILIKNKILMKSVMDTTDSYYINYDTDKISLSSFLQYAISNNWVDLSKLDIGTSYYSTDEIYDILITKINDLLIHDNNFNKMIYKSLIFSYKLSGKEICLLLFDQGVLEYNEEEISQLKNGTISSYTFIRKKIESLEITPGQLALEPCSGSLVITDPNTGEVLAMVSYPSYDNNKLANKVDADYYAKLVDDGASALITRPTTESLAPGSTFKMISSIAGLNEGVITTNEKIKDAVTFKKITPSPSCHNKSGHGSVNVETAIRDSCNYYFYEVGWRLGGGNFGNFNEKLALSKLENYANMFGLNRTTGIELPEREPQFSYDDAVRSAIGQGKTRYTPVQLARYVSTIANGGTVYDLTLISKIEDKDGKTIFKKEPKKSGEVKDISNVYWNAVHEGMYRVVNDTSLKDMFQALNVKVAGKTGTAQINEYHPNTALFVSYAPYEKPEIAVTVVIPNGYTSANSADVASKVYDYYFGSTNLDEIVESGANQEENHTNFTD